MTITHEDVQQLKNLFDERYVQVDDCNKKQEKVASMFHRDDVRIELLLHQQKITNWLSTAIAGGIIALLIKVFLGGS